MSEKPSASSDTNIDSVLQEQRRFECPEHFRQQAHISSLEDYERVYRDSVEHPEQFWGGIAEELHWFKKWDKVLEWNHPWAKWFVGGQINLSYNCLDRHVQTWRRNKAAIIWESEPGEVRTLTYQQLHREVQKFANVLKSLGVKKGDRVAIYMGMTPELPIAMLACARIGAPHTVVFGGFAANALVDRIHDSQAVAVITQDGSYRRGSEVKLFPAVEEALQVLSLGEARHRLPAHRFVHSSAARTRSLVARVDGFGCRTNVQLNHSTPNIRSTFSTRLARPANRRASCIRPAAIPSPLTSRRNGSSISRKKTRTGAPPTSDGSLATAISFTARCRMAPPA